MKFSKREIKKIKEALVEFNEMINQDPCSISDADEEGNPIPGTERPFTSEDMVEFTRTEWEITVEKLAEAGLDIEEDHEER